MEPPSPSRRDASTAEKVVVPTAYFLRSEGLSGSSYGMRTVLALTSSGSGSASEQQQQQQVVDAADTIVDEAVGEQQDKERHVDMLLLLAKCSFPALFVAVGGAVAIPANAVLTQGMRTATEEMAGGALLVTYAFELTKGYTLHSASGNISISLVLWSFAGTLLSAQLQAAAQGMWPFKTGETAEEAAAAGPTMGDALPFCIAFFVDGVVLAYDTPPPPSEDDLEGDAGGGGGAGAHHAADHHHLHAHDAHEPPPRHASALEQLRRLLRLRPRGYNTPTASAAPNTPGDHGLELQAAKEGPGAASRVSNEPRASNDAPLPMRRRGLTLHRCCRRIRPALSALTFVVSIDNFVTALGMFQMLDTKTLPGYIYYLGFVFAIYLGGIVTACIRQIPSEGVQAAWYAFGAFSLLDGGLELATRGLTEFVLLGFMVVWVILLAG